MHTSSNTNDNTSLNPAAIGRSLVYSQSTFCDGSGIEKLSSQSYDHKQQRSATVFSRHSTWTRQVFSVSRATETVQQGTLSDKCNLGVCPSLYAVSQTSLELSKVNTIATRPSRFHSLERSSSFLINLIENEDPPAYGQTWGTVRLYDIFRSDTERRKRIANSLSQIKDDAVRGLLANARSSRQQELDDLLVHGGFPQAPQQMDVVIRDSNKTNQRVTKTCNFGDSFSVILSTGDVPLVNPKTRYQPGISKVIEENFPPQVQRYGGASILEDPPRISGQLSPLRMSTVHYGHHLQLKYCQIPKDKSLENFNRLGLFSQVPSILHNQYKKTKSSLPSNKEVDSVLDQGSRYPVFLRSEPPVQSGEKVKKSYISTVEPQSASPIDSILNYLFPRSSASKGSQKNKLYQLFVFIYVIYSFGGLVLQHPVAYCPPTVATSSVSMPPKRNAMSNSTSKRSASDTPPSSPRTPNGSRKAFSPTKSQLLVDQPLAKKRKNLVIRTTWTFVMIFGFFALLAAGPICVIALVTAIQVTVYKEVIGIATIRSKEKKLSWFKSLNWYFLAASNYFLYGESIIYYFKHIVLVDAILVPFATHHRFISFILYIMGFVFFVANLQKGSYKFQFTQFCWTHMTLLLVVFQSHFVLNNIFEGLIWLFLPACMVITNDIFAYVCGYIWGRTRLIQLSPKKTVEGFIGGWICTIVIGGLVSNILMQFKYMICPVKDLGANAFSGVDCIPNPVFISQTYTISPHIVSSLHLPFRSFNVAPIQFHVVVMATFASLIAPFGGFFASGVKRAFQIKDFGHSIPGHGGMTDRMDCQFLMGFFSYMYYQSFIANPHTTVGSILQTVITQMSHAEQKELVAGLVKYLNGQGIWYNTDVGRCLGTE